mgnify:CR=1 FL=1
MKKISRRSFLMATGVIAASAALSACGGSSASTSSAGSTAASTGRFWVLPHRAAATS